MLFLHLPEALQTLPALRDIRDGPVELLCQRLVYLDRLSPFKLQAAGHLPLSRHGGSLGCRHRSEHEQEVQEEIQERRTVQRKEIPEPALECEVLDAPEVPGKM